ncbi:MAG TPA: TRAP transporter substrate-binding protein [Stellaceae bacterium]|jgi:TRAP-type C4-dicarboxylate transport system substrate-binding protein|nr:TRAP transporter substrate-binding protein [Stellaceae bacterium]
MIRSLLRLTALLAVVLAAGGTRAEERTLIFATTNTPTAHLNVQFLHPWAEAINQDGKGAVQLDIRDGTAIASVANYYDRVTTGVVQISWGLLSTVAGKFPRSDVATLPFMAKSAADASQALWRLYKAGTLGNEFADLHPLMIIALTPSGIHMSHPLKSLDNLGGAKLVIASKVNADAITLLGGAPLSIPLSEMYEAIQRGTADGAAVAWTSFDPFKLAEVTSYHVDTRLGTSSAMMFMTKATWDSLSPEAQKAIDKHSGEMESRAFGAWWDGERKAGKDNTIARGDKRTIVELTPEQTAAWQKKLEPINENWAKNTPDGAKVLAAFKAEVAKIEAGQ